MSKILLYRGYAAAVEFDAEDEIFTGHLAGINDIIGFHADNVAGMKAAFHEAVNDYLAARYQAEKAMRLA